MGAMRPCDPVFIASQTYSWKQHFESLTYFLNTNHFVLIPQCPSHGLITLLLVFAESLFAGSKISRTYCSLSYEFRPCLKWVVWTVVSDMKGRYVKVDTICSPLQMKLRATCNELNSTAYIKYFRVAPNLVRRKLVIVKRGKVSHIY